MTYLRRSLLLLGSFAFGYNIATALHELGHACSMWVLGGTVDRILLHPFSWSYTCYGTVSPSPMVTTWSGAAFSTTAGLVILAILWRSRSAWLLPLCLTGICTLVVNGIYIGVDGVFLAGGDATALLAMGGSRIVVVSVGIVLLSLGLVSALAFFPFLGFSKHERVLSQIVVLQAGIGTYLVVMLMFHLVFNREEIGLWLAYVGAGEVVLLALPRLSMLVPVRRIEERASQPAWPPVLFAVCLGLAIVVVELLT